MINKTISPARERVLTTAEHMFDKHGYTAVSLRDIADVLGLRPASLYNHISGGKEQLFIDVVERRLERYQSDLEHAIANDTHDLRAQLQAAALWIIAHPPLHHNCVLYAQLLAVAPRQAEQIDCASRRTLLAPIECVVQHAYTSGKTRFFNATLVAEVFVGAVESLRYTHKHGVAAVQDVVDMLLDGLHRR